MAGDAAPPPTTRPALLAEIPTSPPPGVTEADAEIVWVTDESLPLGVRSAWLSSSSRDAGGSVWLSASRQEPVLASGSALYALRTEEALVEVCDCKRCDAKSCSVSSKRTSAVDVLVSVELSSGRKRRLSAPPSASACEDGTDSVSVELALGSGFGSSLDYFESVASQPCEAPHPQFSDDRRIVDVATGVTKQVTPTEPQIVALLPTARKQLQENGCLFAEDDTAFWGAALVWGPGPVARGAYTFIRGAPYACGTGPGHYSVATTIETSELPADHPPVPQIPAWVGDALRGDVPRGLSPIEDTARFALSRRFRSAPVPAPRPID
jgi:hypothetical protein